MSQNQSNPAIQTVKALVPIILALIALLSSAFANYSHDDKKLGERVTAVEVQQRNDTQSINRVEGKVDKLDAKLDRLVEWAFGKR